MLTNQSTMKKIIGLLLLVVVTISLAQANGRANDFDKICKIYTEAYQKDSFLNLSASNRPNLINQNIKETVQPGNALDT